MYVSCKIVFNRPKNKNQNNWFLEDLGEQSQHGVCSGVWKKCRFLYLMRGLQMCRWMFYLCAWILLTYKYPPGLNLDSLHIFNPDPTQTYSANEVEDHCLRWKDYSTSEFTVMLFYTWVQVAMKELPNMLCFVINILNVYWRCTCLLLFFTITVWCIK